MSEILLICRACLSESDNLLSIFKTTVELNTDELYLYELMKELIGLQIKQNDEMPQTVCESCAEQMGKFYNFRKQCIESEETLKSLCIEEESQNEETPHIKKIIKLETDFNIYDDTSNGDNKINPIVGSIPTIPHMEEIPIKTQVENDFDDDIMYDEYEVLETIDEDESIQKYTIVTPKPNTSTHDGEFEKFLNCFNSKNPSELEDVHDTNSYSNFSDDYQNDEFPNRCVLCNDNFKTPDELKSHLENHLNDPQYECKVCLLTFKKARSYQNHMRIHKESSANDCNFCGKDFEGALIETINAHIATHKPEVIDGGFLCFFCESKFKQNKDRKRHMTVKHMDLCYKYREKLVKVISDEQDDLKKMAILCEICGKEFISALSLKLHLSHHTGEKPYVCTICDKRFATESYLKDHTVRHNAEKKFICEKCNKAFARKRSLKDHLKRHEGIRPFECHICYTRLSTRASLHMHIRTHTGEKPYREQEQRRAPRVRTKKRKPVPFVEHVTEDVSLENQILIVE